MRFIGSKKLLLTEIDNIINENVFDNPKIFCDIFAGTATVSNFFKNKYTIISNDLLYFSYVIQNAIIKNNIEPLFLKLKSKNIDVFEYFQSININTLDKNFKNFIYRNYSPNKESNRLYLSNENALIIDFIRETIENWKVSNLLDENEYHYLLASLIYSVPSVSNIAGTYGAYLKHWDKRALKKINLKKINLINNKMENQCFNENANDLIKKIKGDIIYIDPPYNQRQYVPNYHLLETIAKFDNPKISGITGVRSYVNERSKYCFKKEAIKEFADLIENANFKYIIVSYSSEGIMKEDEIKEILLKNGIKSSFKFKKIKYRRYKHIKNNNSDNLEEYLFFIRKF